MVPTVQAVVDESGRGGPGVATGSPCIPSSAGRRCGRWWDLRPEGGRGYAGAFCDAGAGRPCWRQEVGEQGRGEVRAGGAGGGAGRERATRTEPGHLPVVEPRGTHLQIPRGIAGVANTSILAGSRRRLRGGGQWSLRAVQWPMGGEGRWGGHGAAGDAARQEAWARQPRWGSAARRARTEAGGARRGRVAGGAAGVGRRSGQFTDMPGSNAQLKRAWLVAGAAAAKAGVEHGGRWRQRGRRWPALRRC
jgi:hypothetical protein